MRVLVTGSQGYIGCLLGPYLVERGHEVAGVDAGFYRESSLYDDTPLTVETLTKDIRQLAEADFDGIDAVVHMAELSNDPLGQLLPTITHEINHRGSVHVAATAKAAGVTRFVYTSSCSVYGAATSDLVDEESPLAPQTAYAECKLLVERDVGAIGDDDFSPTFLRNATAYGASPRMRFDIVLNNLCGLAWTTGEIRMESDGTPWRPLVHALDICASIGCVLEAPRDQVHGQMLNVGAPEANFQVREVAEIVGRVFPGLSGHRRRARGGQTQLPGLVRKDPGAAARVPLFVGSRVRGAAAARSLLSSGAHARRLRLEEVHQAQADGASPGDPADRRVLPLDAHGAAPTRGACTVTPADGRTLVDVGIPTYGEPKFLAKAIESVLDQTFPAWALTISENGPGSAAVAAAVEPYLADPRVRYVTTGTNLGGARNSTGLVQSGEAPYVALLHDDDLWAPEFLERRVAFLDANPSCGLVFSVADFIDDQGSVIHRFRVRLPIGLQDRRRLLRALYAHNFIGFLTALVPRRCYEAVGPEFNEKVIFYDYEMWLRLASHFDVGYLGVVDSYYRIHSGQTTYEIDGTVGEHRLALLQAADEVLPPDFPSLDRRRAWSGAFLRIAVDSLERGDRRRSLAHLKKALQQYPIALLDPRIAALAFVSIWRRTVLRRAWR